MDENMSMTIQTKIETWRAILRLGSLLALGFGEASAQLAYQTMAVYRLPQGGRTHEMVKHHVVTALHIL